MNKQIARRLNAALIITMLCTSFSMAQIDDIDFLRSGAVDGVKILQAYITPYANAFGAGLNGSWYNTAKPHKLGGFDLTVGLNAGMVPESAGTYDVGSLGLTQLTGSGTASTISGPDTPGPTLTKTVSGVQVTSFTLPPGTEWRYVPVPTATLGIGLPMKTELKVRYIPSLNISDGDIGLWGVGIMHSIIQYIPKIKMLPIDISVFGAYTKLQGHIPLSLQPGSPAEYSTFNPMTSFEGQRLSASASGLTACLVASVNIPVLTVYGSLGYSSSRTEIILEGNYPTPVYSAAPVPRSVYNDSGVLSGDELPSIDIKNHSGLRANAGVRIKLAVLTIHADYTKSLYNVFSAGVGISFR